MSHAATADGLSLSYSFSPPLLSSASACGTANANGRSERGGAALESDTQQRDDAIALLRAFTPTPTGEARLLLMDVCGLVRQEGPDATVVAARLCSEMGYDASVKRSSAKVTPQQDFLNNLRHEYVVVRVGAAAAAAEERVVELCLRDHFMLPRTTPRYAEVVSRVPEVFVGNRAHLLELVRVMCSEMATNLEELGLSVPPWRRLKAVASKWSTEENEDRAGERDLDRDQVFREGWEARLRDREVRDQMTRMTAADGGAWYG